MISFCFVCVSAKLAGLLPRPCGPLWPSGSGCGLSICLLLPGSGGTEAMEDHPTPLSNRTPSPAPRPAAQAPESAQCCQVGPQDMQLDPSFTYTHVSTNKHTNTRMQPQYRHICSVSLFTNGSPATHMVTRGGCMKKKLPLKHPHHSCQLFNTQPFQAQVFPTALHNSLSSQGWDTNRWRCFLY